MQPTNYTKWELQYSIGAEADLNLDSSSFHSEPFLQSTSSAKGGEVCGYLSGEFVSCVCEARNPGYHQVIS